MRTRSGSRPDVDAARLDSRPISLGAHDAPRHDRKPRRVAKHAQKEEGSCASAVADWVTVGSAACRGTHPALRARFEDESSRE